MALPERLRAAREVRGWTIEEVGSQLRLPARVIARVEQGDFEGLGAPIYQRGYLRSFARHVGVPEEEVESALRSAAIPEPELVATGVMARGEYVTERYLRPATYIALTALIALPVVWWAASGRLSQELAGRGSFDLQPPPLTPTTAIVNAGTSAERPQPLPLMLPSVPTEMMRASMIAVPPQGVRAGGTDSAIETVTAAPPESETDTATDAVTDNGSGSNGGPDNVVGSGENEAVLQLTGDSWVEVAGPGGRRLHQAMLTPGEWRYRSDGQMSFTIGNSLHASLRAGDREIDLAAHRTSNNVARVDLFGNEG